MGQDEIVDSITGLASAVSVCRSRLGDTRIWCGAFFYENAFANGDTAAGHFRRGIRESTLLTPGVRSFFASSQGTVLLAETNHSDVTSPRLAGYDCGNLAAAFLLADLIEHLAGCRGGESMLSIAAELSGPGAADDTEFPQLSFGSE